MKVKALVLALISALALSATAQEVTTNDVTTMPAKNVSFSKQKGNWFISLQGGGSILQGLTDRKVSPSCATFTDRIGYTGAIAVGKWHNPYFGTRLSVDYNYFKDGYAQELQAAHALNPHFDFMFDMSNYFGIYDANRVFHFVPFVGVGYQCNQTIGETKAETKMIRDGKGKDSKDNTIDKLTHAATVNAGVELQFRLGNRVSLVLAPQVTFANMLKSTQAEYTRPNDLVGQVRAGLTFDLGKRGFEAVVPMDYALLNDLQAQVNSLRAENAELAKRPKECPKAETIVREVPAKEITRSVFFRIGSARVDRNQIANIFEAAEFAKANNAAIVVVGYADAKTGTASYNLTLSERRAREVARRLTDEYGVPSNLVTIEYKGQEVQPFNENAWNRVVIMTATAK